MKSDRQLVGDVLRLAPLPHSSRHVALLAIATDAGIETLQDRQDLTLRLESAEEVLARCLVDQQHEPHITIRASYGKLGGQVEGDAFKRPGRRPVWSSPP